MYLHTVRPGETVFRIARDHGVPPGLLIHHNDLSEPDRLLPGEQLLILTPTRTHTVRGGETLSSIATRYGVRREELLTANPWLYDGYTGRARLFPGQLLAVKYDTPTLGSGSANGYVSAGCREEALYRALPLLTYVTVEGARYIGGELLPLFADAPCREAARAAGKTVLLKIQLDDLTPLLGSADRQTRFLDRVIRYTRERGYHGVTLAISRGEETAVGALLLALRRAMLGCDLLLFCELTQESPAVAADLADGGILTYDKLGEEHIPTLEDGERHLYREIAERCESSKLFLTLPSLSYTDRGPLTRAQTRALALRSGSTLQEDPACGTLSFSCREYRHGRPLPLTVRRYSLSGIRARMEAAAELGYCGISVRVDDVPLSWLCLFQALFARSDYGAGLFGNL